MNMISTSAFYERSSLSIANLRARAEEYQAAIASGQRLSAGSDDPVAAARMRSLSRADAFSAIDTTNASRAASDLSMADKALSTFGDFITRVKELAVQAANGTLNASQRGGIATELRQISGELVNIANSRDSAGHALFGGETTGNAYSVNGAGVPVYVGTTSAGELSLGDGQSVTRGLTGPEFLNFTGPAGATDLFAVVKGLADALSGAAPDPAQSARDALGTLDAGLESVTTAQTVVGARLNWIDLTTTRRIDLTEQRASEEADVGGTDLAATVTRLQETMTVLEASQASFARLSSLSLFDLLR